jgi:MioC protein
MASRRVGIFVATMTGLAELCAEEIERTLKETGVETRHLLMEALDAEALVGLDTVVIVSSTYGQGDIPDNGQDFYRAIKGRGSLAGLRYGVFGLGDRTYADTFCRAGDLWDALFAEKGATRVTPVQRHDASAGTLAEDEAAAWAARWAGELGEAG